MIWLLCSCVEVCYADAKGRHLRATRRISAGEMICAEDAAVAHPLQEAVGKLCQHCLSEVPNPIPSPNSTKVL